MSVLLKLLQGTILGSRKMHQSILGKSTTQREKIHETKQSNCISRLINPYWGKSKDGELSGTRDTALLCNVYVTSQLSASHCRAAMGIKRCIIVIRGSISDQLWFAFKRVSNRENTLRDRGPFFQDCRVYQRKTLALVTVKSVIAGILCSLWHSFRSYCVSVSAEKYTHLLGTT